MTLHLRATGMDESIILMQKTHAVKAINVNPTSLQDVGHNLMFTSDIVNMVHVEDVRG